ncbi:peptidoglycan D,D-transpeptidase FtsI family protein [Paenibacillus daejeonensis]|uniref:peptidoglycan D,D-transpeptidase FtsI family protein n=1 Tax=Paenibacillus daejeonensis TaxID=135193 RepID=UPI0003A1E9FF|nr:penicillin-binding transpeptidase domain-containing protein [Paenibacillus daejeonensis]
MRRRLTGIALGALLAAGLLIGRLAWLQWMPSVIPGTNGDHWRGESVHQREKAIVLSSGRGHFTDRHGTPITGETIQALAAFPVRYGTWGTPSELEQLAGVLEVKQDQLLNWLSQLKEPTFWHEPGSKEPLALSPRQLDALGQLQLDGLRVLPYERRYRDDFEAKHAIGFISQHPEWIADEYAGLLAAGRIQLDDKIGGAGLERSLEPLLRGLGGSVVSHYVDGRRVPMHGLDMRVGQPGNPYYPLHIRTTLDLNLQNQLETAVDEAGLEEGAVVVLDAQSADIVAMISRPVFDPDHPVQSGTDWANHALIAQPPGSLFKLVTAASALEHGHLHPHETFHCNGQYGRYGLSCWKEGGHGILALEDALAHSCNIAFATIAERLSGEELLQTADRLGIARRVGWATEQPLKPLKQPLRLLQEEQAGAVFMAPPYVRDGGQLAQTGIGQRDVRMTPLQAANLVVTLLRGGDVLAPRLVSEIRYANGQQMMSLPSQAVPSKEGQIAPATAAVLLRSMKAVVAEGTGKAIRDGLWQVAGKSGTAQTDGAAGTLNHHWFAGYGPVQAPRYAVAVLVENRRPHENNQATSLFRTIMDTLAQYDVPSQ